ncbi:Protein of unknown function [Pyronema omphalodes CBS 100304]|uniref:Uncharacterized protein n=1 Tax=Pyronema omphalodes (strain CBS 100304) TaxID=1076935 RepID=U4LNP3_PYROM|nr:Protein of unknown function [Pyronema omphalodes CBS 100304]
MPSCRYGMVGWIQDSDYFVPEFSSGKVSKEVLRKWSFSPRRRAPEDAMPLLAGLPAFQVPIILTYLYFTCRCMHRYAQGC